MIDETFQTLAMHMRWAREGYRQITAFADTLDPSALDDFEKIKVIDSFILRLIKIQDLMGNKLFRELLHALGEYHSAMSMLDVLDRMEKLELLPSATQWLELRNLRNALTHEYPDNRQEIIMGIREALSRFHDIEDLSQKLLGFAKSKRILKTS